MQKRVLIIMQKGELMEIWRDLNMDPPFKNGPMNIFQLTGAEIRAIVDKMSFRGFKLSDRTIHRWVSPSAKTTPRLAAALAFADIVHKLRRYIEPHAVLRAIVTAKKKFYYPQER